MQEAVFLVIFFFHFNIILLDVDLLPRLSTTAAPERSLVGNLGRQHALASGVEVGETLGPHTTASEGESFRCSE